MIIWLKVSKAAEKFRKTNLDSLLAIFKLLSAYAYLPKKKKKKKVAVYRIGTG